MRSFPTVHHLAAATEDEINAHWAGLGFYRRASLLHQGAKYVVNELNGEMPTTLEELSKIKGIGPYTAAAIASIAFDVCVPVVDGNVCRVLSRLTGIANHIKHPMLKDKLGWKLAAQIVKAGDGTSPGLVNQALMELGATYCAPAGSGLDKNDPLKLYYRSTDIGRAVLATINESLDGCNAVRSSDEIVTSSLIHRKENCRLCETSGVQIILEQLREMITVNSPMDEAAKSGHAVMPMDPPKTERKEHDLALAVLSMHDETSEVIRHLMVKRPMSGLLAGQWEFPNVCVQTRSKSKSTAKAPPRAVRERTLTEYLLKDLFAEYHDSDTTAAISKIRRTASAEPMDHVFSHIRHIMWVETGRLSGPLDPDNLQWTSSSGKQVRWMNDAEMNKVGLTSGVRKVLQDTRKTEIDGVSDRTSKNKKRKR